MNKMQSIIASKLPQGSFSKNVITLMAGTTFAQILNILAAPVLTRIYSPEDMGLSSIYTSLLAILIILSNWRYEQAIVLPEEDKDAARVLLLSGLACVFMSSITLVVVGFFHQSIANVLGAPGLEYWLYLLPLSLFAAGLFQSLNYWIVRRKQFQRLAARQVTQNVVVAAVQVGLGTFLSGGLGGLVCGIIMGQLVATSQITWSVLRDEGKFLIACFSFSNIKEVALRYKKFPIYDTWAGFFNTASTMLPVLLLGHFFNPTVVGYYALGYRVLAVPLGIIGSSIAQVFFQKAMQAEREGNLEVVTLELFKRLLSLGLVPTLLLMIVAPDFFVLAFGDQWIVAGQYVRYMGLWLFFVLISSPLSTMYYVKERQRSLLLISIVLFASRLLVITLGGSAGDALLTIALLGIIGAVIYFLNCIYILNLAGVSISNVYEIISKYLFESIAYVIVPVVFWYTFGDSIIFVLSGIVSGCVFLIQHAVQVYGSRSSA